MFENFFIKRAEKIQAKRKAEQDKQHEAWKKQSDEMFALNQKAKDILYAEIDKVAEKMKPHSQFVKEGDRAILNIYKMIFSDEMDGWDGGAGVLKNHWNRVDEKDVPIFVTIKNISVDKSYAHEAVDKFLYQVESSKLKIMIDQGILPIHFRAYLDRCKYTGFGLTYGLYFSATFDTEISFKPRWSLSLTCFLKEGTEAAIETEKIWREEIDIKEQREILNERKKQLEERQREINEQYKGIRILNKAML
jgi:hypothetical protein